MRKKIIFAFLIALLIIPVVYQVTAAKERDGDHDRDDAPISHPLTTPISFFTLKGEVTYHEIGKWFKNMHRFMDAANVAVTIETFFGPHKQYHTTTGIDGTYSISLPPGLYKVWVDDGKHTLFVPKFRIADLHHHDATHVNFQGLKKFSF